MLISEPLPFVKNFIDEVNQGIKKHKPDACMTSNQKIWLSFCIMAVLMTNTVCWAKFERASLGKYSISALSWMFRNSMIPWELLLTISIMVILKRFGIKQGNLGVDDTDKRRSKSTKKISNVHKLKDKASGGYFMGQCIVFLVLITPKITIPVGFAFFMPDPVLKIWKKEDEKLKAKGIPKSLRPVEPPRDENYPTIPEIALKLLEEFKINHTFNTIWIKNN
ncbi:MAG: hypothetical protein HQK79_21740 [Desulfobacterales bacterium]|nr:hypothetical protein [Desulfobacterales bacterium]